MRMTRQHHPPTAPPTQGPARFQRTSHAEAHPGVLTAAGAGLALLGLVIGVPTALLLLAGTPDVPTTLPTRETLTAALDLHTVLTVLLWVVWLAWLQFVVCVVVETISALRGVGLPRKVPLAGPSQHTARALVAAVLLLATATGTAGALAPSHAVTTPDQAIASHTTTDRPTDATTGALADGAAQAHAPTVPTRPSEDHPQTATAAAPQQYRLGDLALTAEEGAELLGQTVYVVHPPEGRHHDNLWDIAERTLGDGRRYVEIFDLNVGRSQPDGRQLTLERLIQPGWLLVVPADATGVDVVTVTGTSNGHQEPLVPDDTSAPDENTTAPDSVDTRHDDTPTDDAPTVDHTADPEEHHTVAPATQAESTPPGTTQDSPDTAQGLLGAGLLAAGLLTAVESTRRRRRTAEPSDRALDAELALRISADHHRTARLDAALRALTTAATTTRRPLPPVYAARVDDTVIELALHPAEPVAPAPWTVLDQGTRWRLDATDEHALPAQPTPPAPPALPALVSLGHDGTGADVLLDLAAARGIVTVTGDPRAAREILTAIAAELATNPWAAARPVTGTGLPPALAAIGAGRYETVTSARQWLDRPDDLPPAHLVLGATPTAEDAHAITARLLHAGPSTGVVAHGPVDTARWTLTATADGAVHVDVLGLTLVANRLPDDVADLVAELLTDAPPSTRDQTAPGGFPGHAPTRHLAPTTTTPPDTTSLSRSTARVHVLGAPHVHTTQPVDPDRRALLTELVVHLALHPTGVHPTVLGACLWPRGVPDEVRDATVDRARTWLGHDEDGRPNLRTTDDGRLALGPGVTLDWTVVQRHLDAAGATPDTTTERQHLRDALRHVRGPVLRPRAPGTYDWLARVRLERAVEEHLLGAAHRLAVLESDTDVSAALAALAVGLRVRDTDEILWREKMRLAARTGGTDGVRAVVAELEQVLRSAGTTRMEAQTVALLEELAPGARPRAVPA
ncbi:LysM peptidoglycan-binding domain-containing protein [Sanguibacter suaedae]|uniref:Bacterial transcriptional activator domain-containing protein n=1 Tax=Sanguibacter suaedae TaxID=2795737 RepID=A0A934ME32_9MICO|nr:hypothetical protein [Sanguibacter suaedae]MBI9115334.1 hypothetical protein [Sanguibacter suaedae]